MTEQETQELALIIAQDARLGAFHLDDGPCIDALTNFFRAAVAHGLRMGAEVVEECAFAGQAISAIRAKADEIEAAK